MVPNPLSSKSLVAAHSIFVAILFIFYPNSPSKKAPQQFEWPLLFQTMAKGHPKRSVKEPRYFQWGRGNCPNVELQELHSNPQHAGRGSSVHREIAHCQLASAHRVPKQHVSMRQHPYMHNCLPSRSTPQLLQSLLPEGTWPVGQRLILGFGLPGPCFVRTLNSCLAWTIELFSNFIYLFILIQTLKRISFKKQLKLEVHQALGYLYSASQLGKISFQNGSFLGNLLYDPSL